MSELINNKFFRFPEVLIKKKKPLKNGTYNYMSWTIYVGIIHENIGEKWFANNLASFDSVEDVLNHQCKPFDLAYHDNDPLPTELVAFYIVDSHQAGKDSKLGAATIVKTGKNLNKANRTNAFTQAMAEATKKYNDKAAQNDDLIKPMLAEGSALFNKDVKKYAADLIAKYLNNYVFQYKFDGCRCLVLYKEGKIKSIYSRNMKNVIMSDEMQKAVEKFCALAGLKFQSFLLDGEIYKHGFNLQKINGYVQRHNTTNEKRMLEYHVYDFVPLNDNYAYSDRAKIRQKLFSRIERIKNKEIVKLIKHYIISVDDFDLRTPEQIEEFYHQALADAYEGLIMRVADSPYIPDSREFMFKFKELMSDEYPIVGFKDGQGKNKGLIIFVCRLTEETMEKAIEFNRRKDPSFGYDIDIAKKLASKTYGMFSVDPSWTDDERADLYIKFKRKEKNGYTYFENNYHGKLLTIEFQGYSSDLKPLRLKASAIQFSHN